MRVLATLLLTLCLWPTGAEAQPSLTPAAGPPGSHSPYQAVPPLPYTLQSPMPSLPPPQEMGAEEPLPPGAGHVMQRPGYNAMIHDDGRLIFDAQFLRTGLNNDPMIGPRYAGTFDIGDILTNLFVDGPGFDPYVSDKLELLHETFAQRVELRSAHNELIMDRALSALPEYLSAVWNEPSWDLPTRRRILFALWDECAEDGSELTREGGEAARKSIMSFIERTLPAGSAEGYSNKELSALNQIRSSYVAFAPDTQGF
jgi:hypothetical protein